MIVVLAFELVFSLVTFLLGPIFEALPKMPDIVGDAVQTLSIHMSNGFGLLYYFLGPQTIAYMGMIFKLVFEIEIFLKAWGILHFVITKIPFLNIDLE